jgi:choline dehydrogenase
MADRRIYWPRGRVLGGSSSINGLIVIRGQDADYDHWRDLGNAGWGADDVLPYFVKSENNDSFHEDQRHGHSGPLSVSSIPHTNELIEAFIAAAQACGVPRTEDFNGRDQEGAGYYQLTTRNGWRASSAQSYLRPAERRSNVSVLTDARVTRIHFKGRRATGISYRQGGRDLAISARCGVILSAGAVQSPQLLKLSGIGDPVELQRHGIPVVAKLPGVGRNLQDHLQIRLIYECTKPVTTNDQLRSWYGRAKVGLEWLLFRSGPLAIGINQGGLFTKVLSESTTPDIQFHVGTLSADMAGGKIHDFPGLTLSVCQLRPHSTGTITLASADPMAAPLIHANYLAEETDRRCAIAAMRFARRLASTEPLAGYIAREVLPGKELQEDDELLQFARTHGATIFHPAGTCRMGAADDAGAVVDSRLRVYGLDGLWVVDCSIMPTLVSGNTNVPAIMIGEKAADMIREDMERKGPPRRTEWLDQPQQMPMPAR